jgi:ABC-type glycerol-3-phosphate transport system permease component
LKRNTDIFTYPPSLIPRTERTVTDPERGLDGATVYVLPGRDGEFALAQDDVPIAEFRRIDDPTVVVARPPDDGLETDRTTLVDGEEETVYLLDVDGEQVDVYRARLTVGGLFVPISGDGESVVELVNLATPDRTFGPRFENFSEVVTEKNLGRSLTNTVLVTIAVVVGQIITSVLGGYAFARIDFKGRDQLFLLYLGSVMIPFVVLIIPLFQLMLQLGWTDNLVALIIPFVFTAYGTFLMRQFFLGIPKEIEEAALIDGASRATILWKVMVPLARPAIATLATFGFLYAWNSFFWPLVIINSGNPDNGLLTLTLATLGGRSSTDTNLVFAGAVLAMTPPILVFLFAQRYFVENSASSGLK